MLYIYAEESWQSWSNVYDEYILYTSACRSMPSRVIDSLAMHARSENGRSLIRKQPAPQPDMSKQTPPTRQGQGAGHSPSSCSACQPAQCECQRAHPQLLFSIACVILVVLLTMLWLNFETLAEFGVELAAPVILERRYRYRSSAIRAGRRVTLGRSSTS